MESLDISKLDDKSYRLNNLYHIVDKSGRSVPFRLNAVQKAVSEDNHRRKLCLKARQLGLSTYAVIDLLDDVLFNANYAGGIVSYSLEHAQHIYKRIIGHALETLHHFVKSLIELTSQSARELSFKHGSYLRVDTSLRGGSYQSVLVSEFGKTCARSPQKAEEVVTGTLQAVSKDGKIVIESTAEGTDGYFASMCKEAAKHQGGDLPELSYRFFFFPWYTDPLLTTKGDSSKIIITSDQDEYFAKIEAEQSIKLSTGQREWYCLQEALLGDKMKQEFPSTMQECFTATSEGLFYRKQIERIYAEKRICAVPWEETIEVHTSWDLGFHDSTSIWFFQIVGKEIHLIDYIEASGEALTYYLKLIKEKPYIYGRHLVPHDAQVKEYSTGLTRVETALKLGIQLTPVPRLSIHEGIDAVRNILGKCWFDEKKCSKGIKCIENYSKEWNQSLGAYTDSPRHDEYSHGSDSLRYLAIGLSSIVGRSSMTEQDAAKYERMYK